MFRRILAAVDGSEEADRMARWAAVFTRCRDKGEVVLLTVIDPDDLPETVAPIQEQRRPGRHPLDEPGSISTTGRDVQAVGGFTGTVPVGPSGGPPGEPGVTPPDRNQAPFTHEQIVERARATAEAHLKEEATVLRDAGIEVKVHAMIGEPAATIVDAAKKLDAGIIAVATRRRSRIERALLGSVSDEVVRNSPLPVLSVAMHEGETLGFDGTVGRVDTVVVPLDGSEEAERAIPTAGEIARTCGAKVIVVRVTDVPTVGTTPTGPPQAAQTIATEMEARMGDAAKYIQQHVNALSSEGIEAEGRSLAGSAAVHVAEILRQEPAPMAVMVSSDRRGLERFIFGSVTDQVIRTAGHPVLVV